jgi:electron transfer flavoprotein alpha subunit
MASNQIWILADLRGGAVSRGTLQLIGAARGLAAASGGEAVAVLVGGDDGAAAALAEVAPIVLHVEGPGLEPYEATRHAAALAVLVGARGAPAAFLAATSPAGLETMPRLAALLGAGYLSSCVALAFDGGALVARRPVHGGKAYENVAFTAAPALVTVRPGGFAAAERLAAPGRVETVAVAVPPLGFDVVERRATATGRQDVAEAKRVVAAGRGMGDAAKLALVEDLAAALDAAVGASRALVDAGIRPHSEQVGKSGKTISPELYVACGISGAIHHTLGMSTAKLVVAINTDPDALVFKSADFGLVGDGAQIVPALAAAIRKARQRA